MKREPPRQPNFTWEAVNNREAQETLQASYPVYHLATGNYLLTVYHGTIRTFEARTLSGKLVSPMDLIDMLATLILPTPNDTHGDWERGVPK